LATRIDELETPGFSAFPIFMVVMDGLSQSRHQGSMVCQHLPADKDREGEILRPGELIAEECVWKDSQQVLMCLFSMTAAKQKTVKREGTRAEYIRAHRTPAKQLVGEE
ncbi:hypothetical protein XENOCAPTIV_014513, partial [Xenoophorus captivus]